MDRGKIKNERSRAGWFETCDLVTICMNLFRQGVYFFLDLFRQGVYFSWTSECVPMSPKWISLLENMILKLDLVMSQTKLS